MFFLAPDLMFYFTRHVSVDIRHWDQGQAHSKSIYWPWSWFSCCTNQTKTNWINVCKSLFLDDENTDVVIDCDFDKLYVTRK
jgi:hypothetical protein